MNRDKVQLHYMRMNVAKVFITFCHFVSLFRIKRPGQASAGFGHTASTVSDAPVFEGCLSGCTGARVECDLLSYWFWLSAIHQP